MAEAQEEILKAVGYVLIVLLGLISLVMAIVPYGFTGTEAGSFTVAMGVSHSISGLSLVDEGFVTRFLNGTYDIEIGLEEDSDKPLKNYYVIVTPYRNKQPLKPIKKNIFIGNVNVGNKPIKLTGIDHIEVKKESGKPVEVKDISKTDFTNIFCTEPSKEQIKEYIMTYSSGDTELEKWVKTIIMKESSYVHCQGSITGNYGLMMLGEVAAMEAGISDRFDAGQNVKGGIEYYRKLLALYSKHEDKYLLAAAQYNCGNPIWTTVSENCDAAGIYTNCWEQNVKERTRTSICQGLGGPETCNYVTTVQSCVEYYARNPECYNAPGSSDKCPKSDECKKRTC